MQILLVEDDELIAKGLTYSFKQNEYNLVHKTNIKDTSNFLQNEKIEFIILDISLPDGNGLDLYNNIIKKLNIPTIFLTAKDDEETIVKGLELGAEDYKAKVLLEGANDYITKPFSTKELIVRMKKIILRTKKNQIIEIQDIKFDIDKMVVYRNKEKIEFTSLEIKILHLLFMNLNKVVTRNEIIDKIWEWTGNDVNDNTVTVYLKRIREKLQTDIIITIKGIGYRIDENEK